MDHIEFRGKPSKHPFTGEELPAAIAICLHCGKYYHMFFKGPLRLVRSGIAEFEMNHKDCKDGS